MKLPFIISRLYKTFTNKKLFSALILLTAILLVSGFPGYIVMMQTEGKMLPTTPERETYQTTVKHVAVTPITALLYAIGFIGLISMANIKNPNYTKFVPLSYIFICISYGLLILLDKFTLGF